MTFAEGDGEESALTTNEIVIYPMSKGPEFM